MLRLNCSSAAPSNDLELFYFFSQDFETTLGYNGQVPDLVDFREKELYEIKPNNSSAIQEAQNKLTNTVNEYQVMF
jgi:hypothetical protein